MGREDWYRRSTWTETDRQEFFARNARSRGADSKAEYMYIQAENLLKTGDEDLIRSALELLQQSFHDFPTAASRARGFDAAGCCRAALGKVDEAIGFYRRAIAREVEYPGIGTCAGFHFAEVVVEADRRELYPEAVVAAESFGHPVFPMHVYWLHGIRAAAAEHDGDTERARRHAKIALEAAGVRDTGLSHGRGHLFTVRNQSTRFLAALQRLADA